MKQSININDLIHPISRFFERYHSIIFFLVIGLGLGIGMFVIISIINTSGESDMPSPTINQAFDEATLKRVEDLKDTNSSDSGLDLPDGRINPFVE